MSTKFRLAGAATACAIILSAQSQPPSAQPVSGPAAIDKTSQTEDLKFRDEPNDRMTVSVRLEGAGPYRFLVDTGADRTAISRDIANRLGLATTDGASLHSLTGVSSVATANIANLQFLQKPVKNVDAALLESRNMGADGILGVDTLRSQRVVFDFEAQTMSVVPSGIPESRKEPGAIVIEAKRRNGRLIITDAQVNGKSIAVILDTGAEVSIGNQALRQLLLGWSPSDPSSQIQLTSVTGQSMSGEFTFVKELMIGDVGLHNLAVVFADAHTFRQLKLDKKPALLLGMNAIRAFKKVSIDFANRRFRVVVPEKSELEVQLARL
jgi:predicted aspartyl protease